MKDSVNSALFYSISINLNFCFQRFFVSFARFHCLIEFFSFCIFSAHYFKRGVHKKMLFASIAIYLQRRSYIRCASRIRALTEPFLCAFLHKWKAKQRRKRRIYRRHFYAFCHFKRFKTVFK